MLKTGCRILFWTLQLASCNWVMPKSLVYLKCYNVGSVGKKTEEIEEHQHEDYKSSSCLSRKLLNTPNLRHFNNTFVYIVLASISQPPYIFIWKNNWDNYCIRKIWKNLECQVTFSAYNTTFLRFIHLIFFSWCFCGLNQLSEVLA